MCTVYSTIQFTLLYTPYSVLYSPLYKLCSTPHILHCTLLCWLRKVLKYSLHILYFTLPYIQCTGTMQVVFYFHYFAIQLITMHVEIFSTVQCSYLHLCFLYAVVSLYFCTIKFIYLQYDKYLNLLKITFFLDLKCISL